MTIEIIVGFIGALGVAIIAFGIVMAITLNKLTNKNCPEGTQNEGNWTRFKLKGEL
ncbi:MAG: hypothetical protein HN669_04995 [Candidatus Marinimicrobia bacterium]|jgi:uncharacterized membrane protein|nr:hypothetical protein [Candidatus Neomarinimicrobiota bacterium]